MLCILSAVAVLQVVITLYQNTRGFGLILVTAYVSVSGDASDPEGGGPTQPVCPSSDADTAIGYCNRPCKKPLHVFGLVDLHLTRA